MKRDEIPAQEIYDLCERGFFDGRDMHEFFAEVCGEPSPSGYVMLRRCDADDFIAAAQLRMETHSPGAWARLMAE